MDISDQKKCCDRKYFSNHTADRRNHIRYRLSIVWNLLYSIYQIIIYPMNAMKFKRGYLYIFLHSFYDFKLIAHLCLRTEENKTDEKKMKISF